MCIFICIYTRVEEVVCHSVDPVARHSVEPVACHSVEPVAWRAYQQSVISILPSDLGHVVVRGGKTKNARNHAVAQAPAGASPGPPRKMSPEFAPVHEGQKMNLVMGPPDNESGKEVGGREAETRILCGLSGPFGESGYPHGLWSKIKADLRCQGRHIHILRRLSRKCISREFGSDRCILKFFLR